MRQIRVSSTLTVFHDGQFWVGTFERVEGDRLSACRVVFGAEPSNEEVLQFVVEKYERLRFTDSIEGGAVPKQPSNPKRRQREAARDLKKRGASTKAQQALSEEREATARQRKAEERQKNELERDQRFEMGRQKRKQKHRGH